MHFRSFILVSLSPSFCFVRARNNTSQLKSISNKLDKNEADISQLKDQLLLTAKR